MAEEAQLLHRSKVDYFDAITATCARSIQASHESGRMDNHDQET